MRAINAEVQKSLGNIAGEAFTGRKTLVDYSGNSTVKQVEGIVNMITRPFSERDLQVLKTVTDSNIELNLKHLDLIIHDLNKIRRVMIEVKGFQVVLYASQEGFFKCALNCFR